VPFVHDALATNAQGLSGFDYCLVLFQHKGQALRIGQLVHELARHVIAPLFHHPRPDKPIAKPQRFPLNVNECDVSESGLQIQRVDSFAAWKRRISAARIPIIKDRLSLGRVIWARTG
jgi:hypothetical protein